MIVKVTGPVCGMTIEEDGAAATVEHDGRTYYSERRTDTNDVS